MNKKLTWIDALRAIAIIMVVAVHARQHSMGLGTWEATLLNEGQMGVQLFFIVSAITLCMSASARREEPHPVANFYSRRFFRIAPAYWMGILFYYLWSIGRSYYETGIAVAAPQYTFLNVLSNIFFVHGFYPPANNNIVPGGWSIGTEMAFYAIFPLLWRWQDRLPLRRLWVFAAGTMLAGFAVLGFAHWVLGEVVLVNNFWYFNITSQLGVFVIGMCAYRWMDHVGRRFALGLFLVFFAIGSAIWVLNVKGTFYVVSLVFGLAFAGAALYFAHLPEKRFMKLLAPVGKVSFSMYLFHFAVLDALGIIFHKFSLAGRMGDNAYAVLLWIAAIAVTFVIARLSYRFVEKPGIAFGKKLTLRWLGTAEGGNGRK